MSPTKKFSHENPLLKSIQKSMRAWKMRFHRSTWLKNAAKWLAKKISGSSDGSSSTLDIEYVLACSKWNCVEKSWLNKKTWVNKSATKHQWFDNVIQPRILQVLFLARTQPHQELKKEDQCEKHIQHMKHLRCTCRTKQWQGKATTHPAIDSGMDQA